MRAAAEVLQQAGELPAQSDGEKSRLAIDGRLIVKSKVAISETYNTQLEAHLARLGHPVRSASRRRPGQA